MPADWVMIRCVALPRGVVKDAAKPDTNPLEYRSTPLLAAGHLIEPIRLVLARRGV